MNFHEMNNAVQDARRTQKALEAQSESLCSLLIGNLRNVTKNNMYHSHDKLRKLKAELSQYNASTRTWKN